MTLNLRALLCVLISLAMIVMPLQSRETMAEDHIVSSADLHRDLAAAAETRGNNQASVLKFFSSDQSNKALKSVGLPYQRIQKAVSQLSGEELARLAVRTGKVNSDFAAGALTNQELTYIIIALATAVVILVIVER